MEERGDTATLREALVAAGLLLPTGVEGLYAKSGAYEQIFDGIGAYIAGIAAADGAELVRLPPGMNRAVLEKAGYMKGFPHLAGTVHSFCGGERDHQRLLGALDVGEDWTGQQVATDIALTPAACYPLYPMAAARGPLPMDGLLFDIESYCFRHEPSSEPTRMQMFRMREFVRIGTTEATAAHLAAWRERTTAMMAALGLDHDYEAANDPFFGRGGRLMADNQRDQGLKTELVIPVNDGASATACVSFNRHGDHFGATWDIVQADGSLAHSACVAFGMERLVVALLKRHGLTPADWPATVRAALGW